MQQSAVLLIILYVFLCNILSNPNSMATFQTINQSMKNCTLSIKYWKNNPKTVGFLQVICILQYIQHILLKYRVDRLPVNFVTIQSRHKTKKNGSRNIDRSHNKSSTDRYLQSRATYIEMETYTSNFTTYVIYMTIQTAICISPLF